MDLIFFKRKNINISNKYKYKYTLYVYCGDVYYSNIVV